MKLEVGKKYVCRNRPDIKYVEIKDIDERLPVHVRVYGIAFDDLGSTSSAHCGVDGRYWMGEEHPSDLVAEYKEPVKWAGRVRLYRHINGTLTVSTALPAELTPNWVAIGYKNVEIVEGEGMDDA